jgi:hypothetical protein
MNHVLYTVYGFGEEKITRAVLSIIATRSPVLFSSRGHQKSRMQLSYYGLNKQESAWEYRLSFFVPSSKDPITAAFKQSGAV